MVILRCAPLSATCAIDWDAWAAIATALGVLAALAAPYLGQLVTRGRANALFAMAYKQHLTAALEHVTQVCIEYHEGHGTQEEAWEAEAIAMTNAYAQAKLGITSGGIVRLAEIDLDLSRWPSSVSLDLAARVAAAIHICRQLQATMLRGSKIEDDAAWTRFWPVFRKDLIAAAHVLIPAIHIVRKAGAGVIDERLERHRGGSTE